MDEAILARLNQCVKAEDHLYFLGDFCMGGPKVALTYREKIRCRRIHCVLGNHDRAILKIADQFIWMKDLAEVTIRDQRIVMCHYAMRTWHQAARGAWHLCGRSHGKLPPAEGSRSLDVGVDTNDLRPYSFDELRERLNGVKPRETNQTVMPS